MLAKDQANQPRPTILQLVKDPRLLLAFGFGSGMSRVIPGTMGTLAAIPFYLAMVDLGIVGYCLVVVISFMVGCYLCDVAAKKMGVHDHPGIVWDEFVGLWITFIAIDFSWSNLVAGFVLFRFFDMVKPWPIGWLDRQVHGGIGIMLDDVIAAVFAWACLYFLLYFDLLLWMPF